MLNISEAKYIDGYKIHLRYENGVEGDVDFSAQEHKNMFAPWKDKAFFSSFNISPESGTLQWENGLDISPEFLYSQVAGVPQESAFSLMMAEQEKLIVENNNDQR